MKKSGLVAKLMLRCWLCPARMMAAANSEAIHSGCKVASMAARKGLLVFRQLMGNISGSMRLSSGKSVLPEHHVLDMTLKTMQKPADLLRSCTGALQELILLVSE